MLMMDVPSPTTQGESVELICSYELDEDKLYSVKWYKDDVEFYRYVPNDWPPGQFLPLQGVRVDKSRKTISNFVSKLDSEDGSIKGKTDDTFSALETAMECYEQQSERCPTQLLLPKRMGSCSTKTKAGGIIGPYFFKNDEGHNVTVNGDRYRVMITNFFIPELNNHDVQELWFQQDGATCHTARATIDLLKDTFGDRLISRFGPVNWPPRSCDLTPLDYFLWGCVKSLVYADKPQTLDHLEDNIRRVIADIRPQMLEKVIENWTSRLDFIRASRGSHMPEIIFKM
ncbi:transposase [Trichonephila clavipes]|nr:transposase [Trichonephila clavipes]